MKNLAALLILSVVVFSSCMHDEAVIEEPVVDEVEAEVEVEEEAEVEVVTFDFYTDELVDVSGGTATGYAGAYFSDEYYLFAEFEDLPVLEDGYFYEGWVVRQSPLSVISTGATVISEDMHYNEFSSEEDLTDHDFYVLTLEPDDGDPAPAAHILEGTMIQLETNSGF